MKVLKQSDPSSRKKGMSQELLVSSLHDQCRCPDKDCDCSGTSD